MLSPDPCGCRAHGPSSLDRGQHLLGGPGWDPCETRRAVATTCCTSTPYAYPRPMPLVCHPRPYAGAGEDPRSNSPTTAVLMHLPTQTCVRLASWQTLSPREPGLVSAAGGARCSSHLVTSPILCLFLPPGLAPFPQATLVRFFFAGGQRVLQLRALPSTGPWESPVVGRGARDKSARISLPVPLALPCHLLLLLFIIRMLFSLSFSHLNCPSNDR